MEISRYNCRELLIMLNTLSESRLKEKDIHKMLFDICHEFDGPRRYRPT